MMAYLLEPGQVSDCGKIKIFQGFRGKDLDCLSQLYYINVKEEQRWSDYQAVCKVNIPNELIDLEFIKSTGMIDHVLKMTHFERHLNEIRIFNSFDMSHPNIVNCLGMVTFGDIPGILMPYIKPYYYNNYGLIGLAKEFHNMQKLEEAVLSLTYQGLQHKDIRPANILDYHLIDFGIACPLEEDNGLFWNRAYAPPEYKDEMIHKYSDLYSFGLYAMEKLVQRLAWDIGHHSNTLSKETADMNQYIKNHGGFTYYFEPNNRLKKHIRENPRYFFEYCKNIFKEIHHYADYDKVQLGNSEGYADLEDRYVNSLELIKRLVNYLNPNPDYRLGRALF
ncbi:hypothetical protein KY330_00470 [Candidatus Woesearchaeota archaeon]|nr:hypothetical protein [Candidatus Woesearchaeota archaeon]